MLTLITAVWYVCGALFVLYIMLCAVCILILERAVNKRAEDLFDAQSALDCLFEGCEYTAGSDVKALSDAYARVLVSGQDVQSSFDFYRQKELFEDFANEYDEAARKYNGLVENYPSCVVARVMGKEPVPTFSCE